MAPFCSAIAIKPTIAPGIYSSVRHSVHSLHLTFGRSALQTIPIVFIVGHTATCPPGQSIKSTRLLV